MKNPAKKFAESEFARKHQPRPSVKLFVIGLVMTLGCFFLNQGNGIASMLGFMLIMAAVTSLARFLLDTARSLKRGVKDEQ